MRVTLPFTPDKSVQGPKWSVLIRVFAAPHDLLLGVLFGDNQPNGGVGGANFPLYVGFAMATDPNSAAGVQGNPPMSVRWEIVDASE